MRVTNKPIVIIPSKNFFFLKNKQIVIKFSFKKSVITISIIIIIMNLFGI